VNLLPEINDAVPAVIGVNHCLQYQNPRNEKRQARSWLLTERVLKHRGVGNDECECNEAKENKRRNGTSRVLEPTGPANAAPLQNRQKRRSGTTYQENMVPERCEQI
jgi:hypothetical protein